MITITPEKMSDAMQKYHLHGFKIPLVVHEFTAPDTGLPHCHPFDFTSHVLHGSYIEEQYYLHTDGNYFRTEILREAGESFEVKAETIHRIIELPQGSCTTIITPGEWKKHAMFWKFENGKVYNRICHEHNEPFKLYEL